MLDAIERILIDEETIRQRVGELANRITADYQGQDLLLVATLKGAIVFCADLMRRLELPVCLSVLMARSYGASTASDGTVELQVGPCGDVAGRQVLIVEDIVDTGRTLSGVVEAVRALGPASVRTCCLLDKPSRRVVEFTPDYVGFEIPDHFVVGYGLDFSERYRNLPYIAVLRPEAYQ